MVMVCIVLLEVIGEILLLYVAKCLVEWTSMVINMYKLSALIDSQSTSTQSMDVGRHLSCVKNWLSIGLM